jgi:hypothetical protein
MSLPPVLVSTAHLISEGRRQRTPGVDNGNAIFHLQDAINNPTGGLCPVYIKRLANAEVVEKEIQHKSMAAVLEPL